MVHARKFLVVLKAAGIANSSGRSIDRVADCLSDLTGSGSCSLAFTSESGDTAGVFVKTDLPAGQIRSRLERRIPIGADGAIWVLELGWEWATAGDGRAAGWLRGG